MKTECKLAQNLQIVFGCWVNTCQHDTGAYGSQFHVGWMRSGESPIQTSHIIFAQSGFSGYFCRSAVCTPGGYVNLGSCVFTYPEATEATPLHHWHRARHLRVAISKVAGLGVRPWWLRWLSAVWPHSGWEAMGWDGGCRVGDTYWQGPAMFSEAQSSGSITQCDEEKRPAANESQQCLSHWTTTWKALCNCDAINISKLSLNKLSVFIFPIS